jgi:hypothetical protein
LAVVNCRFLAAAEHVGIPPEHVIVNECIENYYLAKGDHGDQAGKIITLSEWLSFFDSCMSNTIPNVRIDKDR